MCFCVVQKKKGVADAMIEACKHMQKYSTSCKCIEQKMIFMV